MKVTGVVDKASWGWPRIGTLWLGHFVLLGGDACLVTGGRFKHYCVVISSEHKGERMMNIQRLVIIGCVGFFLLLAVINGLAVGNSPVVNNNHPQPVRAPMAMQAPVQTTPAAPGVVTATAAHPQPQPQPVPVPPAAAATVAAPTQAEAVPVSLLLPLLVVSMVGLMIGLVMVLVTNRRKVYGRFPQPSILAPGVQS